MNSWPNEPVPPVISTTFSFTGASRSAHLRLTLGLSTKRVHIDGHYSGAALQPESWVEVGRQLRYAAREVFRTPATAFNRSNHHPVRESAKGSGNVTPRTPPTPVQGTLIADPKAMDADQMHGRMMLLSHARCRLRTMASGDLGRRTPVPRGLPAHWSQTVRPSRFRA